MAYAEISSYPPLGQLTVLNENQSKVDFVVLVEWHKIRPAYPFELALCYSHQISKHESQWPVRSLRKLDRYPRAFRLASDEFQRKAFTTSVDIAELFVLDSDGVSAHAPILFTVKYRVGPQSPWKWAGGTAGAIVGQLLRSSPPKLPYSPGGIFDFASEQATWHFATLSESTNYQVWRISSAAAIQPNSQDLCQIVLGHVRNQIRTTSIVRLEPYWFGVSSAGSFFHLSEDAVLCNFLNANGQVVSLLAFNSNDKVYTVLRSGPSGELIVAARNDSHEEASFTILVAVGQSERVTIKAVMDEARNYVNKRPSLALLSQVVKPPNSSQTDLFYDGLTFCTWNALGQKLTATKVEAAVQQLSDHSIDISSLLIDDNWQSLGPTLIDPDMKEPFFCGMADFAANQAGFPSGLSGLIQNLRHTHPKVENVGVWHALFGYWGGISPGSPLTRLYKTRVVQTRLMGEISADMTIIDPSDIHKFYDDFYSYLKGEGITFIKTDVQHMLSNLISSQDRQDVISAYQSAWTLAYQKHFSGRAISCMSQVPEIVFHSLLQDLTPKILHRNSDDFYPEVPASHPWHIFVNAYNSLVTEHLNVIPDWDMFQTAHSYSSYHAAARCISGGPVMITDVPGEHDIDLIKQITCKSPTGRTAVLRPENAKTIGIWERYSDKNILRIGSKTQTDAALLGLFNISEDEKHTFVSASDFPGLPPRSAFVVHSHRTGQIFPLYPYGSEESSPPQQHQLEGGGGKDLAHVKLDAAGWDIITASPLLYFQEAKSRLAVAVLGLHGKMSGIAAVTSQSISDTTEHTSITVRLKALGVLRIWLSHTRLVVREARLAILPPVREEAAVHDAKAPQVSIGEERIKIKAQEGDGGILEVDLLKIFDEQSLWRKSSNSEEFEVEVKLSLGLSTG